jgi:hypothetical protein
MPLATCMDCGCAEPECGRTPTPADAIMLAGGSASVDAGQQLEIRIQDASG